MNNRSGQNFSSDTQEVFEILTPIVDPKVPWYTPTISCSGVCGEGKVEGSCWRLVVMVRGDRRRRDTVIFLLLSPLIHAPLTPSPQTPYPHHLTHLSLFSITSQDMK